MNPQVDRFLSDTRKWQREMEQLRAIALDCGLGEELKWGKPCYTYQGGNVAIIQGFKERCALMFFKGALLQDPDRLLEKPGANSQAGRRMMFTSVEEVLKMEKRLRRFIVDAIEIEKAGLKVEPSRTPETPPEELKQMFKEVSGLKQAFDALTPGRRRAYILYFSGAKQSKTRRSRIEKWVPAIQQGKGLND